MIDRVAVSLQRSLYEVPVGFKWFVQGLLQTDLGFAGEESAGATFLRKNGRIWTTDKDGIVPALLAAEMTAQLGKDPAVLYDELTDLLGNSFYSRIDLPATPQQRKILSSPTIAGDKIEKTLSRAPGNDSEIGGLKIETKNGWIALRPSGTEDIYKIYAESFRSQSHLNLLLEDGQKIANQILGAHFPLASTQPGI
jgi:phosphoglucomutase